MKKNNENIGGGSVFARGEKLYIKYKGKQFSTGLNNSTENISLCYQKLKEIKLKEFLGIKESKIYTVLDAWKIFEKDHLYNKAYKTVISYRYAKDKLINSNYEFTEIEIDNKVRNFLKYNSISNNSKKIVLRHFNAFLNFSYTNGLIDKKINLNVKHRVKVTKKIVRTFTEIELTQIFEYWNKKDKEFSLMLQFMVFSGFRIGETLDLTWKQIDFANKDISVPNKISKDPENFPLSTKLENILFQLKKTIPTERVFRWSPNSKSSLNRAFDKGLSELKITKNERSFHNFRKTFRMKLFRADIPLEDAKELLRHKDIKTTIENYTEFLKEEKRKQIEKI